jgi:hypothetical protein
VNDWVPPHLLESSGYGIRAAIGRVRGLPAGSIGHFVLIYQLTDDEAGAETLFCCSHTNAHAPAILRALAADHERAARAAGN